jgi:hypothetical protein
MLRRSEICTFMIAGVALSLTDTPALALTANPAALHRIADRCHLPRSNLHFDRSGRLHFQPRPDERYRRVDCAMRGLRRAGLGEALGVGFVEHRSAR